MKISLAPVIGFFASIWPSIKNYVKTPVALAIWFSVLVLATSLWLPQGTRHRAEKWLAHMTNETSATLTFGAHIPEEIVQQRLQAQANTLSGRARFHKEVMLYFISNYYSGIIMAAFCGGMAAVMLVVASKNGWTNRHALAMFLMASAFTTFFVAFPALFKQEENASRNKVLYVKYVNLLNEMRTHASCKPVCYTNTVGLTNFLAYIDGEMAKANDIAVAFDPTKIPTFANFAPDAK